MANVYYAPVRTPDNGYPSMFLAGSIDMGSAVDWQQELINSVSDLKVDIYNPRRTDWDPTWVQSITNLKFREQVTWELHHLECSNIIVYYFDPKGKAPITLMELGLYANNGKKKIAVCCPSGYWRRGNIEVLCYEYALPLFDNIDDLISWTRTQIKKLND